MAFIEYNPKKSPSDSTAKSKVRINFSCKKKGEKTLGYVLIIRIGRDLADKLDIKSGDKVSFSYDDENKRIWLIKKIDTDNGYKIGSRPNALSFMLQITWDTTKLFKPDENEINKARYVSIDFYQDSLKIDAGL